MDSAIWGLVGTAIGALASIGTTWLSNLSSFKLEETKVVAERAERANAFQRETLLALQEALHDAFRLYSRAYLERRIAVADGANWQETHLTAEVNEGVRLAQRQASILIERISNDSLRGSCKTLMDHGAEALLSTSHEDAEARHFAALDEATQTLEQLGVVLRSHY